MLNIKFISESQKRSKYMLEYNFPQWLAFFYIYCFIGWCYESTYCSIRDKKLTNRGFLHGTLLPIYGSGALALLLITNPVKDNIILTFIFSMIGATILELVTGIAMEFIFKVRYWDYSKSRLNFKGYISLVPSLLWGIMGVLIMNVIHSPIERLVLQLEHKVLYIVVFIITISMAVDFTVSFRTAIDLRNILISMEQAKAELMKIHNRMDFIIATAGERVSNGKEFIFKEFGERKKHYEEQISIKLTSLKDMKEVIENKLDKISFISKENPKLYNKFKNEINKLRKQYKKRININESLVEYRKKEKIKIFKRNPSITSKKFAESLEEVKKYLFNKRDKGTG